MSSKNMTAMEESIQLIKQDYEANGRLRLAFVLQTLNKAKEMESQKQQKYDEMLEILEKHLIFHNAEMEGLQQPSSEMWFELYGQTEQLIKEVK
jgi:hypothetical protein